MSLFIVSDGSWDVAVSSFLILFLWHKYPVCPSLLYQMGHGDVAVSSRLCHCIKWQMNSLLSWWKVTKIAMPSTSHTRKRLRKTRAELAGLVPNESTPLWAHQPPQDLGPLPSHRSTDIDRVEVHPLPTKPLGLIPIVINGISIERAIRSYRTFGSNGIQYCWKYSSPTTRLKAKRRKSGVPTGVIHVY